MPNKWALGAEITKDYASSKKPTRLWLYLAISLVGNLRKVTTFQMLNSSKQT